MDFPKYPSHHAAKQNGCFNCYTSLLECEHSKTEYPCGVYAVKCPQCTFTKFYDIENNIVEDIRRGAEALKQEQKRQTNPKNPHGMWPFSAAEMREATPENQHLFVEMYRCVPGILTPKQARALKEIKQNLTQN